MWYRNHVVSKVAGRLMDEGHIVFSPITHSRVIASKHNVDQLDHDYWLYQDRWFVKHCTRVYVLAIWGWKKSKGVAEEMRWAETFGKPVVLINRKGEANCCRD